MKLKEIKKIFSLQTLQKIQDNYSTALGIPISIRNKDGDLITKLNNPSKLWSIIHSKPAAEEKLLDVLKAAMEKCQRTSQIVIFERHPDTQVFLAPIHIGGQIVAFFVSGLVRFGNPNIEIATKQANLLGIELDTYLDAYLNLPFFTQKRLEAAANLIKIIGNTISNFELEGSEVKIKQQEIQGENLKLIKSLETTQRLNQSQDRYKQLFDTINEGIYLIDFSTAEIVEINQAGSQIFGYGNPQQLTGKNLHDFFVSPANCHQYLEILEVGRTIHNWLIQIKTSSGQLKYLETSATLIIDKNSGKKVIQGVFHEIHPHQHRAI